MENGVIIYLEDANGGINVVGKVVGEPKLSQVIASEILALLASNSRDEITHPASTSLQ